MVCKNCNTEIPDNLVSCPKCGKSTGVSEQLYCKKCGTPLNGENDFCASCGTYTEKKKEEIESNKQSAIAFSALGFIVPIMGFIFATVFSKSNPDGSKAILIASIIGLVIETAVFIPSMISMFAYL